MSIWLIDRVGRRALLLWSLGGMAVTLLALWPAGSRSARPASLAWLTVLSLAAYVAFFAVGLGPVFWLLIAEIFPLAVRGRAMSLATIVELGLQPAGDAHLPGPDRPVSAASARSCSMRS